tara:strand:- start:88 stop:894 length:807 start_codon:yes stop_codon:yes gene_type:complete
MKRLEKIKEHEKDLVTWENFEGATELVSKKKKELEKLISELNTNTDWIRLVDSFDDFQKQLAFRQENIESKVEAVNMSEFFKSELTRLFDSCTPILSKSDLWEYCLEENLNLVVSCQNSKLEYLKECLLENGIDAHGPTSILDAKISDYKFFDVKSDIGAIKPITESEKRSAKLKLTIMYKLGIIDHLRTFDSLKKNDRALSRVLNAILDVGGPNTFQTYLSAERSAETGSSAPQNNPLSKKLLDNAAEKLKSAGLTDSEIKKFYPKN